MCIICVKNRLKFSSLGLFRGPLNIADFGFFFLCLDRLTSWGTHFYKKSCQSFYAPTSTPINRYYTQSGLQSFKASGKSWGTRSLNIFLGLSRGVTWMRLASTSSIITQFLDHIPLVFPLAVFHWLFQFTESKRGYLTHDPFLRQCSQAIIRGLLRKYNWPHV